MVIKPFLLLGLAADLDGGCDEQLSEDDQVYDTQRWTKLTAPETINRARDMVGAHQNLG